MAWKIQSEREGGESNDGEGFYLKKNNKAISVTTA